MIFFLNYIYFMWNHVLWLLHIIIICKISMQSESFSHSVFQLRAQRQISSGTGQLMRNMALFRSIKTSLNLDLMELLFYPLHALIPINFNFLSITRLWNRTCHWKFSFSIQQISTKFNNAKYMYMRQLTILKIKLGLL